MHTLFHKKKFHDIPGDWNELTRRQLLEVVAILHRPWLIARQRLALFRVLTGWSWWKMAAISGLLRYSKLPPMWRIPASFGRAVDNTLRLAEAAELCTDFIYQTNTLTTNLLPSYRRLYGPSGSCANLRVSEWVFAEHYFTEWRTHNKPADLDRLIATIYRPAAKKLGTDDSRRPFDGEAGIANRSVRVARWPLSVRTAIGLWYSACRMEKVERHPLLFGGESAADTERPMYGMWSVMRRVAKAGHFGTFDQVAEQFVDTILMELQEAMAEAQAEADRLENMHQKTPQT